MFCALVIVFGGAECVGSRFHFLHSRTSFRQYRGRRVAFSCFALPDSFLAVLGASGPVFLFCAPRLIFGGTEDVGSHFLILHSQTRFRRYRRRRVPFSCFPRPDSFSDLPRAWDPVFMFCVPGLVFDSTDGVGTRFHVVQSETHFWRYRGRRVLFSCFALPDSFSAVPKASGSFSCFAPPDSF
jgi:hypothetical protein